jgi:hypothetical protein
MFKFRTESNWFLNLSFVIVFIALCWVYRYNVTFFQPPQSVHTWRQTNSLSVTQMYYQYNLPFLQPEIHNQLGDDGMSGKVAGEFPVIYYFVAKVWQLFGKAEWSFRLIHLLLIFTGIFLLFRMLIPITGNAARAGFASMLVFTSPMFVFYGPNFLPDAPALAFTFIAWFFLYRFIQRRKDLFLWLSAIFFFLAISLKITTATGLIAIALWMIIERVLIKPDKRIFNFGFRQYTPFIISILLVFCWYFYVYYFNNLHKGEFSHFGIWPVWDISVSKMEQILDVTRKIYLREFFSPQLQFSTVLIWLFMLLNIRKLPTFSAFMLVVMPLSFAAVLVLWFQVLDGHDYYFISQMQVMIIIWAIFFNYLKNTRMLNHPVIYVLLTGVFLLLANDGNMRHNARYEGWMNHGFKQQYEALTEIEPYFIKWNINPSDKVICLPDYSINASLYYMNRKGYTDYGNDFTKVGDIKKRINQGARYLVVLDTTLLKSDVFRQFTANMVGNYKNVRVFDLRGISIR